MLNIIINIITSSAIPALNCSLAILGFIWIIISLFVKLHCKKTICLKLFFIFRTRANVTKFSTIDNLTIFSTIADVTRFSVKDALTNFSERSGEIRFSVGAPARIWLC